MLHLFSYVKRSDSRDCKARFQIRKQILSYVGRRVFRLIQTSFRRSRAELDLSFLPHEEGELNKARDFLRFFYYKELRRSIIYSHNLETSACNRIVRDEQKNVHEIGDKGMRHIYWETRLLSKCRM